MMNNDTLRKAVELADGWNIEADTFGYEPDNPHNLDSIKNIRQHELDALAAQLVRQVDALDGHLFESGGIGQALIWRPDDNMRSKIEVRDCNRTENAIKAIVESGVLE